MIPFQYYKFQHVDRFASFTFYFSILLVPLDKVRVVLGLCAADFRRLTSFTFIQVRSCSCILLPSTSVTGSFASASLSLLFHIPLFPSLLLTLVSSVFFFLFCVSHFLFCLPFNHTLSVCVLSLYSLLSPPYPLCLSVT